MIGRLLAAVLFVAFATGHAQAGLLTIVYDGSTDTGSAFLDTGATDVIFITEGTPLEIRITFDSSPQSTVPEGVSYYALLSATVEVGGTSYSVTPATLGDYLVALADPSNSLFPGEYIPAFGAPFGRAGGFLPTYTAATPPFSASAPSPTVFSPSDFSGFLANTVVLFTPPRAFLLVASSTGFSTSIVSVPEPAGLVQLGLGAACVAGLLAWTRKRGRSRMALN